jgi:tryptophanyl-tRNA synthetase
MDNLACGVDPDKSTIFIQSMIPNNSFFWLISVFTVGFLCNLATVTKLE